MATVKTCEHYVLSKLEEAENTVITQQETIVDLTNQLDVLGQAYEKLLTAAKKFVALKDDGDGVGPYVIGSNIVIKNHDEDLFNTICSALDLKMGEDE